MVGSCRLEESKHGLSLVCLFVCLKTQCSLDPYQGPQKIETNKKSQFSHLQTCNIIVNVNESKGPSTLYLFHSFPPTVININQVLFGCRLGLAILTGISITLRGKFPCLFIAYMLLDSHMSHRDISCLHALTVYE